ncbi:DUF308 domain-containing protein [Blastococcus sp. CT_GayMR20]|uniref:HdeD family acid-resistance protein n=1 Tax=Blastococcus sp. CT_GayMR20 TaxID=2559609 RepID=UPI001430DFFF|nr:DUF308 domain-containing protein [Blastococcus sp. CT_GayMR20]
MAVSPTAAGAEDPVVDRLAGIGRSPALVIAEGALGTVLGVVVLAWPGPTATVLAVLLGVHLLISGVLQLVAAFSDATRWRGLSAVLGTLSLLVGLLCLRDPLQIRVVLGLLIGIAWTVGGVIRVGQGIVAERGPARGWRMVSGAVSLVAGAVVLVYPGATIVVLTAVLGVVLIVEGACLIATGFTMRRKEPTGTAQQAPPVPAPGPAVPVPAVPRPPVRL